MEASVKAVENLLKYRFNNKNHLEAALTHGSYSGSPSYQRLEFVGDAALGLAFSNHVFLEYPDLNPGKLSLLRVANISNESLARVAVRHRLYKYVRHNADGLDDKVREFVMAVQQEDAPEIYGGLVKAPKVLADIVESVAAAVYIDCNFDLKAMWVIIRDLLEPIVMLDVVEQQPQPVTMLFELCQKYGKQVKFEYWREGEENNITVFVFVDGSFVASASSEQKENAKLHAAKVALDKLSSEFGDAMKVNIFNQLNEDDEIDGAKQKLHELCGKKKWPKPKYKIQDAVGLSHQKKYRCSVEIEISEGVLFVMGLEKSRVKEAENSAASIMLHNLKDSESSLNTPMAASRSFTEGGSKKMKSEFEIRYPPMLNCFCGMKASMKVVKSWNKPSKGHLHYSCATSKCSYFSWANPIRAKWEPIVEENNNRYDGMNEIEDESEAHIISRASEVGMSTWKVDEKKDFVPWAICMGLYLFLVILLLK